MRSACLLALTGGGIMARFTTQVLEELQAQRHTATGKNGEHALLRDAFDLMAGTSAGALCVAGLAVGRSPGELSALFDKYGTDIFPQGGLRQKLRWGLTAKYDAEPLRQAVDDALDKANPLLGDVLPYKVAFPAVDESLGQPIVFTNADPQHLKIPLRDAVLASAAAPTYFPAHRIKALGRRFVDGGLFANAPDFVALTLARQIWPDLGIEDLHLVSIGTTSAPSRSPYGDKHPGAKGLFAWAVRPPARILKLAMRGQVDHAVALLSKLQLADFIRIDTILEEAEELGIDLDNASTEALNALIRAGCDAVAALPQEKASRLRMLVGRRRG